MKGFGREMAKEKIAVETFRVQPCLVCNSERFNSWRWSGLERCAGCEYVRKGLSNGEEPPEEIQQTYFDTQFALQHDFFTQFYERLTAKRRLRELKQILPAGRVLEVGVGRGTLLCAMKSSGYSVEGLDLSP